MARKRLHFQRRALPLFSFPFYTFLHLALPCIALPCQCIAFLAIFIALHYLVLPLHCIKLHCIPHFPQWAPHSLSSLLFRSTTATPTATTATPARPYFPFSPSPAQRIALQCKMQNCSTLHNFDQHLSEQQCSRC